MAPQRREFRDDGRVFTEEKMRALIVALVLVLTGCAYGSSQGQFSTPYNIHHPGDRGGKG
jgi:hypothetical protein